MTAWRVRIVVLTLLVLGVWLWAERAVGTPEPTPLVSSVDAIGITVADVERSARFYRDVLGFERIAGEERAGTPWEDLHGVRGLRQRVVRMRLGTEIIELTEPLVPRGRPLPADSRSNDRWFQHIAIIVNDMDQAYLWLQRHRVERISPEPQRLPEWNPAAGGIRAFYFKDPDGHPLELLQLPPDKGDPRWQRPADRVFLGIDHTAIVVSDTDASLGVYRDVLGLEVAGTSENYGPEQERLNNVAGARLRITMLRARTGPGVELLQYLSPRDGRPLPSDARATDLAHWQTIMTADVARAASPLRALSLGFLSAGPVALPDIPGVTRALVVRDPDGHALQLRGR